MLDRDETTGRRGGEVWVVEVDLGDCPIESGMCGKQHALGELEAACGLRVIGDQAVTHRLDDVEDRRERRLVTRLVE